MSYKHVKFYWIFALLFSFTGHCFAQNNETASDSSGAAMALDSSGDADGVGDTVVTKITFDNPADSVIKWKRNPEFGYMAYLDSLLKKKKDDLKIDTMSIDKNAGSSSKTFSTSSDAPGGFLNSFPLKIFFWIGALFFIGFILYKLFFEGGLFAKGNIKRENEPAYEEPEKLSDYSVYNHLIYEAELKNDFNLATRYLYLQSLKKLAGRELILFSPEKTNNVYVQELSGNTCQSEFASLTLSYEYAWYGMFAIKPDRYRQLKEEFILFNKKI